MIFCSLEQCFLYFIHAWFDCIHFRGKICHVWLDAIDKLRLFIEILMIMHCSCYFIKVVKVGIHFVKRILHELFHCSKSFWKHGQQVFFTELLFVEEWFVVVEQIFDMVIVLEICHVTYRISFVDLMNMFVMAFSDRLKSIIKLKIYDLIFIRKV